MNKILRFNINYNTNKRLFITSPVCIVDFVAAFDGEFSVDALVRGIAGGKPSSISIGSPS